MQYSGVVGEGSGIGFSGFKSWLPLVGWVFPERQPRYKCLVPHLQSRITIAFKVKKGGTLKYRI